MALWSDLPPELLALTIAKLPNPADRIRSHAVCRAVCRGWHSAVHHHHAATARQRLPWIIFTWDGDFLDPSDGSSHHLPSFPDDTLLLAGSSYGWLLLAEGHEYVKDYARYDQIDGYLLHNPFSRTSVPFPEMNADFRIRKFLMRSTADDLVAILTNKRIFPLIVFRPGKGAWWAKPHAVPYINTIDIAFLGDKLYGITKAEDLISLDLATDANGTPMAINHKCVIGQPLGYDDYDSWTKNDDEEVDEDGQNVDDDVGTDEEERREEQREARGRPIPDPYDYWNDGETKDLIITTRNLVESCGKLLMVRRHVQKSKSAFTRQVDVFEADTKRGMWVPLPTESGLGGGQALFTGSMIGFSKSIPAPHGEVEEDTIYFVDTGKVFNMKSQTSRLPPWLCKPPHGMTWLFPPKLVL